MIRNILPLRSLKTRVTMFTLAIFVISIWTLAFYASRMLREDMERLVGDQQFSTVSLLAAQINEELTGRLRALEVVAVSITPAMLGKPAVLQAFLEQRTTLLSRFNGGLTVFDHDGTVIADVPLSAGRVGGNYMDREYVAATLKEGKSMIGEPVMAKALKAPIVAMTVPIRDVQGKVIAAFGGPINLGQPNFLSTIMEEPYGKTGGYILVSVKHRLVIIATDKTRIMQPLAAPGINPQTDRFIQGFEGYAVYVNPRGEEVMNASKRIPIADWNVAVTIPAAEALAPIRAMQERMLLATAFLTLLVAWLTWWMLRRELAPMLAAAKALATRSEPNQPLQPLPIQTQDEIGELIGGFNRLLETLARREQALTESEARYRQLFENNASVLLLIRPDSGAIADANASAARFYRYSIDQLRTMRIEEINCLGSAEVAAERERAIHEERNYFVFPHRLANGEIRTVEVRSTPIRVRNETLLFSIVNDITDRKRVDEALRESEKRLSAIFQSSPIGIGISTIANGKILDINDAALRLYGYTRDEVIGRTVAELGVYVDPRQREEIVHQLRETGGVDRFPMDFRNSRGEVGVLEISGRVIFLLGEQCMVLMLSDVTERMRLEEIHLQAQKLESLGTLAGGIAHDFNNILAAIRGNTELATQDVGPDHVAAESLQEIKKAAARASELVRRIMAFGRPRETGHKAVDLGAVTSEVLRLLRSTLPARIALNKDFAADTPQVLADSGQVHEVIVNLTTNAVHAIGERAGSIQYRLEPVEVDGKFAQGTLGLKPGRYVRLTVTDDGCGMDERTLERIFDAFYTTKPVGQGTGLGLSMVHGTMTSHGGAVTVESIPGKGSSFALFFPVADEQVRQVLETAPEQSLLAAGRRVLYLDDEEALVLLAGRALSRLGHQVSGFTGPEEALAAFRAHPQDYDVVVTDLSMPKMSGFEFAREVLAARPGIPVVMTTGYIEPEREAHAREAGIAELIPKPTTMNELAQVLDRLFRASEADGNPSA